MNDILNIDSKLVKEVAFTVFAVITLFGAGYLLLTKNILYAAYGLLVAFLGMSGLYVFAGADFVAVTQIMVYIGGILVLMIFGIMLTQNKVKKAESSNAIIVSSKNIAWGIVTAVAFFVGLVTMLYQAKFKLSKVYVAPESTVDKIGISLLTENLLMFEVVGVLLLIALVGAAFVAKKLETEK
ncbi:MAG: NADH:ubiquinone oxidoreductase subunit 6 (subunit J) [Spirosomataceae bacterium]|jgi:NADH-quinone oxidoreductase subunit J